MTTTQHDDLAAEIRQCWMDSIDAEGNLVQVLDTGRLINVYSRVLALHTGKIQQLENVAAAQQTSIELLTKLVIDLLADTNTSKT